MEKAFQTLFAMSIFKQIEDLKNKAEEQIQKIQTQTELDQLHSSILGKKGELTSILKGLKDLSDQERREAGSAANETRKEMDLLFGNAKKQIESLEIQQRISKEKYDALKPIETAQGHLHPVTAVQYQVEDIFSSMGFRVMDGPEVETDDNNFGKLNFSEDHPARDMQDTFWTEDGNLLRTHTSSVQVRAMEKLSPPFRIIAPGRVFRYEETDASHENTFYQVEGMLIDRVVSVSNLIYIMKTFLSAFFERDVKVRLRPGYFPFVEPGFELDIHCLLCSGKGCPVCKQSGWLELLPCGLVHPNVIRAGGMDPSEWQGFAFGMGLMRLVMMKYSIEDIRHFLSGNLRFLKQF